MKKRRIRPASEELGCHLEMILFTLVWYSILVIQILERGFEASIIVFLLAGLIPILAMAAGIKQALYYRAQRREAIALGRVQKGTIVGVSRKAVPVEGKNGRQRYRMYYFLTVEIINPQNGAVSQFLSQPYSRPIHQYLASPRVSVYTDQSGWQHYLEDFEWKEQNSDPDIFNTPKEYNASGAFGVAIRAVTCLILIFLLISILSGRLF